MNWMIHIGGEQPQVSFALSYSEEKQTLCLDFLSKEAFQASIITVHIKHKNSVSTRQKSEVNESIREKNLSQVA